MNPSNHPAHTTAPESLPALLIYVNDLVPSLAYVLSVDHAGRWQMSVHVPGELPNLTDPSHTQPIAVEAAGYLRDLPYPGVSTTVTTTEGTAS